MASKRTPRRGLELLGSLPDFLIADLIKDEAFQAEIGYRPDRTIVFADQGVTLAESEYFEAVARLLKTRLGSVSVLTEGGETLTIALGPDGSHSLSLTVGDRSFFAKTHFELEDDPAARLEGFDRAAAGSGLPRAWLQAWRETLRDHVLDPAEARELNTRLEATPVTLVKKLYAGFHSEMASLDLIAPANAGYYDCLVGDSGVTDLDAFAQQLGSIHVPDLLAWAPVDGAKRALLVATHIKALAAVDWRALDDEQMSDLLDWAVRAGDPFAKVGVVQIALARGGSEADPLQAKTCALVEDICRLNPADPAGPLHLLSAVFVLVEAELSRTRVLAGWSPFRRRAASLAQAALFLRAARGQIDTESFARWAFDAFTQRFYFQTEADLLQEPRWLPEYISPEQLHAELVGQLHGLANAYAAALPEGPLKVSLIDKDGALMRVLKFPHSFRPGPLEGASGGTASPLPPDLEALLDASLASETLEPSSLAALINLAGTFRIDAEKTQAAVKLIKAADYRTAGGQGVDLDDLFAGLANVACMTRAPDLADQLRIMCRRRRADGASPPPAQREAIWAMTASAAHVDLDGRLELFGSWIAEIAFAVSDKAQAAQVQAGVEMLCACEPKFRKAAGRALAALDAFVRS